MWCLVGFQRCDESNWVCGSFLIVFYQVFYQEGLQGDKMSEKKRYSQVQCGFPLAEQGKAIYTPRSQRVSVMRSGHFSAFHHTPHKKCPIMNTHDITIDTPL